MILNELLPYLPENVKKILTIENALLLIDNIESIEMALVEEGYEWGTHFTYDSILKDLLPEFLVDHDLDISVYQ